MVMDAERLAGLARDRAVDLIEMFSSIQGEGPRMGERHLFVRTVHCDIHCAYCDTPLCHAPRSTATVEERWGEDGARRTLDNPVALPDAVQLIEAALDARPHAAVSFTGGEPLLQPWLVQAAAPAVRARGAKVLLETDGNLPDAYEGIAAEVDVLSMDWKLASATGEPARPGEHRRMLTIAHARGTESYVKAVFVAETTVDELEPLVAAVKAVDSRIPVVLQPCTPFRYVKRAPTMEHALALHDAVSRQLPDVRLIPQVHKILELP